MAKPKATPKMKLNGDMKQSIEQSLMKLAAAEEATVRIRAHLSDLQKGDFEGVTSQEDLENLISQMALNATALGAVGASVLSHLGYAETAIDGTVQYESILSDVEDGTSADEEDDTSDEDEEESEEGEDEEESEEDESDEEESEEDESDDEDEEESEEDESDDEDEKPVRRGKATASAKPVAAKAKAAEPELTKSQQKLYDANVAGLLTLLGDTTDADAMMKKLHNRMKGHGMDAAKFGKPQGRPGAKGYAEKAARHAALLGKNISKRAA